MIYLNYITHLVLSIKYKMIFLIIFNLIIIYSLLYSQQFINCMNEGDLLPDVAEAKPAIRRRTNLSHVEQSIIQNIDSFIGDKLLIQEQKVTIYELTRKVRLLETENINLQRGTSIAGLKSAEYTEISDLHRSFLTHVHSLREDLNVLKSHIANAEKSVEDIFDAEKESTKKIRNIQERFWDGHNKDFSVYPRFG